MTLEARGIQERVLSDMIKGTEIGRKLESIVQWIYGKDKGWRELLGTPAVGPNLLPGVMVSHVKKEQQTKWWYNGKLRWPIAHKEQKAMRQTGPWYLLITSVWKTMSEG